MGTGRFDSNLRTEKEIYTLVESIKACAKKKDLHKGIKLHTDILKSGILERSPYVATSLISMYSKCGMFSKAQEVLHQLPARDAVSWNALIAGYAQQGQGHEALICLDSMEREGLDPDEFTFSCILKACGSIKAIEKGKQIHDEILARGLLEKNTILGNALVDMYAKCGMLVQAQEVLDVLPMRNVISWSALIAGYAQEGQGDEALNCFEKMRGEGFIPDVVTFISLLKACGSIGATDKGNQLHDEIVCRGLVGVSTVLGTALVDMYAKSGVLAEAEYVLHTLPVRNLVSWSALIAGYAQQGQGHKALKSFEQMQREGISPDAVTFISVLKACGSLRAIDKGSEIHKVILNRGFLEKDVVLGTTLLDMYAKCGVLKKAQQVHDELAFHDIVSWNALISGYAQQGQSNEALNCCERMQKECVISDSVTFICLLKACGSTGAIGKGKQIHNSIVNRELLKNNVLLGISLVDMYGKCGLLETAQHMLYQLPIRSTVSWSALIVGYAQQDQGHEALMCFERMRKEDLSPDAITFSCILKACGNTGAIDKGGQIHDEVVSRGLLYKDVVLGTSLVDMYAKCGQLSRARQVLDELPIRNVASWSALISGYAGKGNALEALKCLQQMQNEGLSPDSVTILCVLTACSHSGLVDEALLHYENMVNKYGIMPTIEHHTCMVDVLGCAGHFDQAMSVINKMPCSDYPPVWLALLSACKKRGNVELGRLAFDRAIELDNNAVYYSLMADIYAAAGLHVDAEKVEVLRVQNAAWKKPANSVWVDAKGIPHSFSDGDKKHVQMKEVYEKLKDISIRLSNERDFSGLQRTFDIILNGTEKNVLCGHNEQLGISCALINTQEGQAIHIVNNISSCSDCHTITALISKIEKRKIIVRNPNHLHVFENGICSCQ